MRHVRRLFLGSLCMAALTLSMALSGCGTTTGQGAAASATMETTSTPFPTATTSDMTAITQWAGCPTTPDTSTQPQHAAVGALEVTVPQFVSAYPSELMPNNEPNAPYQIAASAVSGYAPNPPVNPQLATGYSIQICNKTSASHALTNMSVRIASFTPRSGPVTVWHICQDSPYDAATKYSSGGCGGGFSGDRLSATLPHDSAGASAPVTGTTWPVTIGPNKSISLAIAVSGLTTQGMYALSFGISVDGAAPATIPPSDGSFLIAPSASIWTGTACETPAMQAQIPATSQDTYYVCPPAS